MRKPLTKIATESVYNDAINSEQQETQQAAQMITVHKGGIDERRTREQKPEVQDNPIRESDEVMRGPVLRNGSTIDGEETEGDECEQQAISGAHDFTHSFGLSRLAF